MLASCIALVVSVLGIAFAGGLRDIALVPWALLAILASADLLLSFTRKKHLSFDMAPELFVGETEALRLAVPDAPKGLHARIKWPDGLDGAQEVTFETGSDGTGIARTGCRGVRRGI